MREASFVTPAFKNDDRAIESPGVQLKDSYIHAKVNPQEYEEQERDIIFEEDLKELE